MDDYFDESNDTNNSYATLAHSSPAQCPEGPHARIVEQPAKCGVRFRYECEGRISGAIPGVNSTTLQPTYPTIRVFNHSGRAKVVVSCVTKNPPFRAHPHNLVGKKSCKDGVCSLVFSDGVCAFNNLGILCAKRKDIRERLRLREALRVDPFGTGFGHKSQAFKIIDLAVIRLCFQVYLEGPNEGHFDIPLEPIVSDPIYDKKAMSELSIAKLSHYSAPVSGGTDIILLCDRVIKDDIQIRFYEEREDRVVWEAFADFKANDIHKHFAISFRSPKYCDLSVCQPIAVNIQLKRPSDGGTSESLPFYLLPKHDSKRQRIKADQRAQHRPQRPFTSLSSSSSLVPVVVVEEEKPCVQEHYILPRLLSQQYCSLSECANNAFNCSNTTTNGGNSTTSNGAFGEEFVTCLSQTNDNFIDFDINCIQIDENCNELQINGHSGHEMHHFWPQAEPVEQKEHLRAMEETHPPQDMQLLDISGNSVQRVQWGSGSGLASNQSKTSFISC